MAKKKIETVEAVEKPSKVALQANKELNAQLGGIEEYYHAKSKKELQGFIDDSLEKVREFKEPKFKYQNEACEELAEEFEATKENDLPKLLTITGHIVAHLNDCLTQYNASV